MVIRIPGGGACAQRALQEEDVPRAFVKTSPLVTCEEAATHLDDPQWVFVDCRYDLAKPDWGRDAHAANHIPGSFHAHVDKDLSSPVGDGRHGRHPLPEPQAFRAWCGKLGITPDTRVVCYDDQAGQWASRLWWLLRYYGHRNVSVLDGGMTRWKSLGLPLDNGPSRARAQVEFSGEPGHMPTIDTARIETGLGQRGGYQLVDARAGERYRGEVEPIDKRAGHIPGAISMPFGGNVGSEMRFHPPEKLADRFIGTLGVQDVGKVACYCGSGVTGPHNVLAMEVAGMGTAALYPGSWSEWSWPDAERPVETGPGPAKK
jgi:thiosulfate/3-mercaptopyruvate sulfurtransferase